MIHGEKEKRKIRYNDLSEDLAFIVNNFASKDLLDKIKPIVDLSLIHI